MDKSTLDREERTLVISDIHLGEDILEEGSLKLSEYIKRLNFELSGFIRAHTENTESGPLWHLVINGDMFDFLKVNVDLESSSKSEANPYDNTPDKTVSKLIRIIEIHRPIFKAIAHFVRAGNRLTIIEGNHDAELYFDAVKETFRRELYALIEPESGYEYRFFSEKVIFQNWFEARIGRYHIEHGHQYDPMCSFAHLLAPFEPSGEQLAIPIVHRAIAPFTEVLGDFSTHGLEKWGMIDYLRFSFSHSPKIIWKLAKLYFSIAFDLVAKSGKKREQELFEFKQQHQEALDGLAQHTIYGLPILQELDRLKAKPAEYSWLKIFHALFLDRLLLLVMLPLILLVSVFVFEGLNILWAGLALVATVLAAVYTLNQVGGSDSEEKLRESAGQIAELTGARYIIFGHSHAPDLMMLKSVKDSSYGEHCFYINTGSWVTREIVSDDAKGMTYAELNTEGAFLKRWHSREKPAIIFSSKELQESA